MKSVKKIRETLSVKKMTNFTQIQILHETTLFMNSIQHYFILYIIVRLVPRAKKDEK